MTAFIRTRRLATSTPRDVNQGFPVFPSGTSPENPATPTRIGSGSPRQERFDETLLNVRLPFVEWQFSGNIVYSLFAGQFFGFTMEYTVSGAVENDGTGFLAVSNDTIEGGMAIGLSLDFLATLRLERSTSNNRRSSWGETWEEIANETLDFNIDLIRAIVAIANLIGAAPPGLKELTSFNTVGSVGGVWGLYDEANGQFGRRGSARLEPKFSLSANILEAVPKIGKAVKALSRIGVKIFAGPVINYTFPVQFEVVQIETESGVYKTNGRIQGRRELLRLEGGPITVLPTALSDLKVVHSHTVDFVLNMSLKAEISFLNVFKIDESVKIPFEVSFPGLGLGPFYTALEGSDPLASTMVEIPEVEWA